MNKNWMKSFAGFIGMIVFCMAFMPLTVMATEPKEGDYVDPVEYCQLKSQSLSSAGDLKSMIFEKNEYYPVALVLEPYAIRYPSLMIGIIQDYPIQHEPITVKNGEPVEFTITHEYAIDDMEDQGSGLAAVDNIWHHTGITKTTLTFKDFLYTYASEAGDFNDDWSLAYHLVGSSTWDVTSVNENVPESRVRHKGRGEYDSMFDDHGFFPMTFNGDYLVLNLSLSAVEGSDQITNWEGSVVVDDEYRPNVTVYFKVTRVQLGKAAGGGLLGRSGGLGTSDYADHAGPLTTAIISILAILLSILFGSSGGSVPPVPVGAGGPSVGGSVPVDGYSRWVKTDEDGDLIVTDPINGQKRTFVSNDDGTYTDPVTGATYTSQELNEQMEHREENVTTIRQDEEKFEYNVAEDYERNQERTSHSLETERDLQEQREKAEREWKHRKMAEKLGIKSDASREHIQSAYEHERDSELADSEFESEKAKELDQSIETLETYEEMADTAAMFGEVFVPGGKAVSATYKGIKNLGAEVSDRVGETIREKGLSTASVIEGTIEGAIEGGIKGGTEAVTTMMNGGISKAGVTIGGTVAGEVADAYNDGEDITDAIKKGLVKGGTNASVGAISDELGGKAEGTIGEFATKIGEYKYGKEITDPKIEERFDKK